MTVYFLLYIVWHLSTIYISVFVIQHLFLFISAPQRVFADLFVPLMAAKIFMDMPGGLKMPAIGLGTWQVRDEMICFDQI